MFTVEERYHEVYFAASHQNEIEFTVDCGMSRQYNGGDLNMVYILEGIAT
jgi:hypothetical protein